jgi:hypothetical protein
MELEDNKVIVVGYNKDSVKDTVEEGNNYKDYKDYKGVDIRCNKAYSNMVLHLGNIE